jgi:hypothetical protein
MMAPAARPNRATVPLPDTARVISMRIRRPASCFKLLPISRMPMKKSPSPEKRLAKISILFKKFRVSAFWQGNKSSFSHYGYGIRG